MTEDKLAHPIDSKEAGSLEERENLYALTIFALRNAVGRSDGAAIVNIGELPVEPQELANRLPDYYHVTVEDILNRRADETPPGKEGLLVTGYSRDLSDAEEILVEKHVRGEVQQYKLKVLVVSKTLPYEDVFHRGRFPWFNGPFQGDEAIWSIRPSLEGLELVSYRREKKAVETARKPVSVWVENSAIPFQKEVYLT